MERKIARSNCVFVGANLIVASVGSRIGFGDLGTHLVEDFDLLKLRDAQLGVRLTD